MKARGLVTIATASVILALAAACGVNQPSRDRSEEATANAPAPAKVLADEAQSFSVAGRAAAADAVQRVQQLRDSVAPSMIIRNGNAVIQVEQLDPALAALRRLAQQLGGYVANTSVTTGHDQVPSGTIELKIPATRYDSALAGLQPLGKVESVNTTAEDVGEEFVDVSARVANARRLEERIVAILATRTGKLEDVIAAERELARIREDIERYEGRLRFLRTRVALSTLSVTVHEPYPVVGGPGVGPIAEAFKQMWRNFVLFVAWLIASLGWLIPLSAIGLIVGLGVRKYIWRRRPSTASTASA
ncbi:MAG: DUF4349 domain-containing protein [Gemmatimonadota bacterium]